MKKKKLKFTQEINKEISLKLQNKINFIYKENLS